MIIDKFHNCYNATFKIRNALLNKIKLPAILRLVILQSANTIIPLVFKFQTKNDSFQLNNNKQKANVVVSLTSFPNRISKIHLVIESIFRQSILPSRVILWLSKEQFDSIELLPETLLKLRDRGLEIYLTNGDLRSYKKYYYFLKDNPNTPFIIIDDDVFYKSNVIANLLETNNQYPNAVCANRCAIIDNTKPYSDWSYLKGNAIAPQFNLLPTGCGGVLYPQGSLHTDVLNSELFTNTCKDADDIWLNCCAYLNDSLIAYTGHNEYLLEVKSNNNVHLHTKNVGESNNDLRIKQVREYYLNNKSIDVFER
jgi:hypothetical protein